MTITGRVGLLLAGALLTRILGAAGSTEGTFILGRK